MLETETFNNYMISFTFLTIWLVSHLLMNFMILKDACKYSDEQLQDQKGAVPRLMNLDHDHHELAL